MQIKVKDIYNWTNISDSWCKSKIARFNDILSSFAIEVYDLYPRKYIQRFNPSVEQINTKYPIAKVRGFFGKGCKVWCSLDPKDCCAGFRRLLIEELYWDNLDQNSYAIVWEKEIQVKVPGGTTDAFVVYSKWFDEVKSLEDTIDIDPYTLSLLKLYMKNEYALEGESDINMSANYYSRFQTRYKKLKEMFDNSVKYIVPWALNAANR